MIRTRKDVPENISRHFDDWDMIGMFFSAKIDEEGRLQRNWVDGGDSCHFIGLYYYCLAYDPTVLFLNGAYYGDPIQRLQAAESMLRSRTRAGGYKRHPDIKHWYGQDNRMSRDQWTPLLGALAIWGLKSALKQNIKDIFKRGLLFTTNTRKNGSTATNHGKEFAPGKFRDYSWKLPDIALFDIWSIIIRGMGWKLGYPILVIGDFMLLINALLLLNRKDDDVANFWVKHSLSVKIMPTPISLFTQKFLYPRLKLAERIKPRYFSPNFPLFLGKIIMHAMNSLAPKAK